MLIIDQRPFKADMHRLIATKLERDDPHDIDSFRKEVEDLVDIHGIALDAQKYSAMVAKLVLVGRGQKLVDCLSDVGLSRVGVLVRAVVIVLFKLAALTAFIALVVWGCLHVF